MDKKKIVLTKEEFLKDAKPCDLFQRVQREIEVALLKETYSKQYLLKSKLCTEQEYNTIPASNIRAMEAKRLQDEAYLRYQIVGAAVY